MRTWIVGAVLLVASIAAAKPATRDDQRAVARLTSACMAKHASACIDLAAMGSRAGLDGTGVITWHREACDLGDDTGCFLLASDLSDLGMPKAAAIGEQIFAMLCGAKQLEACYRLGGLLPIGGEAAWFPSACTLGDADGCQELASIYLGDDAPRVDGVVSTKQMKRLCDAGSTSACRLARLSGRSSSSAGSSRGTPPRSPSAR